MLHLRALCKYKYSLQKALGAIPVGIEYEIRLINRLFPSLSKTDIDRH